MHIRTPKGIRAFQRCVLGWHAHNTRDYPWRHTRDPYEILVAEMLLQQTDVAKSLSVYQSFLARYPTITLLAVASIADVEALIAPIGLRYRAERLVNIARAVERECGGALPRSEDGLMLLPGVGRYIARSICAVAYDQRKGVLDTNIIRVLDRCFGIRSARPRPREDPALWDVVNRFVPPRNMCSAAEWNWALLDYAALVCTHHRPRCGPCQISRSAGCRSAKRTSSSGS
jgi:A/G-specific adenine glycosylase